MPVVTKIHVDCDICGKSVVYKNTSIVLKEFVNKLGWTIEQLDGREKKIVCDKCTAKHRSKLKRGPTKVWPIKKAVAA